MTLQAAWAAVWPNLAANVVWTLPVWLWHHSRIKRLLAAERAHLTRELREHLGEN